MRRSTIALLVFLAIIVIPYRARAQEGDDSPCGWDASELENGMPRTVTSLLTRLDDAMVPADALQDLQAWVGRCSDSRGKRAILSLRKALERAPADDGVRGLLAVALARGPEVQVQGAEGVVIRAAHRFSNAEKEALRLFSEVAARQAWPEIAQEAGRLALATRREASLKEAAAILRKSEERSVLAEVELALNNYEAARLTTAPTAAEKNAALLRAQGIAQMMIDKTPTVGATLYLAGLDVAQGETVALYFDDIRLLLTEAERQAWDALGTDTQRTAWLNAAWQWRASTATVSVGERLAENFRRLQYATEQYTRQSYRGASGFEALWSRAYTGVEPLDDRGILYVRHGAPDAVARNPQAGSSQMAWLYAGMAGGRAVIEFDRDRSNYIIPDPSITMPCHNPLTKRAASSEYHAAIANFLVWEAGGIDEHIMEACGSVTMAGDLGLNRRLIGRDLRRVLGNAIYESETAVPRLKKPLRALLNTYAFRDRNTTEVWTLASIQAGDLIPRADVPGVQYDLRFFSAVENSADHTVSRSDTSVSFARAQKFSRDELVHLSTTQPARPTSNATVRVSVRNQADSLQGQMITTVRDIPGFDAGKLGMSDVVVSAPEGGIWMRNGIALAPLPAHRVQVGASFRMFYETYGVTPGDALDVEVVISPGRDESVLARLLSLVDRKEAMSLKFTETVRETTGDLYATARGIQADLKPGTYSLAVTVSLPRTGERVTRITDVVVVGAAK